MLVGEMEGGAEEDLEKEFKASVYGMFCEFA